MINNMARAFIRESLENILPREGLSQSQVNSFIRSLFEKIVDLRTVPETFFDFKRSARIHARETGVSYQDAHIAILADPTILIDMFDLNGQYAPQIPVYKGRGRPPKAVTASKAPATKKAREGNEEPRVKTIPETVEPDPIPDPVVEVAVENESEPLAPIRPVSEGPIIQASDIFDAVVRVARKDKRVLGLKSNFDYVRGLTIPEVNKSIREGRVEGFVRYLGDTPLSKPNITAFAMTMGLAEKKGGNIVPAPRKIVDEIAQKFREEPTLPQI